MDGTSCVYFYSLLEVLAIFFAYYLLLSRSTHTDCLHTPQMVVFTPQSTHGCLHTAYPRPHTTCSHQHTNYPRGQTPLVLINTPPTLCQHTTYPRAHIPRLHPPQNTALVGEAVDLTYPYEHLGTNADAITTLTKGGPWLDKLRNAAHPVVLVGPGVLARPDRDAILQAVHTLADEAKVTRDGWNGYNVMHDAASRVAALDIGFLPSARARSASNTSPKFVYLLGADDFDAADIPDDAFVVYQGSHGDRGAMRADVVLPGAAYTEKSGTYVNMEGRVQATKVCFVE